MVVYSPNHFFSIAGKIFKQGDGSPIGLDLSVEVASIYMSLWDNKILNTVNKLGIQIGLYKCYVDDTVIILNMINNGWGYDAKVKKMTYEPQQK